MPFIPEGRSRRAWRRDVAAYLLDRVRTNGYAKFYGDGVETRREMIKVCQMLPPGLVPELYEDIRYPGRTFLEVRLASAPPAYEAPVRVVRNRRVG